MAGVSLALSRGKTLAVPILFRTVAIFCDVSECGCCSTCHCFLLFPGEAAPPSGHHPNPRRPWPPASQEREPSKISLDEDFHCASTPVPFPYRSIITKLQFIPCDQPSKETFRVLTVIQKLLITLLHLICHGLALGSMAPNVHTSYFLFSTLIDYCIKRCMPETCHMLVLHNDLGDMLQLWWCVGCCQPAWANSFLDTFISGAEMVPPIRKQPSVASSLLMVEVSIWHTILQQ